MSIPRFGNRAAKGSKLTPAKSASAGGSIRISGSGPKVRVLPDGDHEIEIKGGRVVESKTTGSISVVLGATTLDGDVIRLQPLLVDSSGGDSETTIGNRAILAALARMDPEEDLTLDEVVARLTGRVEVGIRVITHYKDGTPVNVIFDVYGADDFAPLDDAE